VKNETGGTGSLVLVSTVASASAFSLVVSLSSFRCHLDVSLARKARLVGAVCSVDGVGLSASRSLDCMLGGPGDADMGAEELA
jgi:hypothetical protein